ncbi:MAG: hypothetical protein B7Y56_11085 [Gallionellales bacterium 35-53-114]|jgi:hypothetical protein|nr:MAG: hypothetical protein B7Y56_11085 [Gallionellales bacterium 35-53-114]OYZ64839.1 MAG: hypothetical protein B7Y04_03515 [Gallionellales bacterium 24-53-125]OZB07623.1 MAG: hypothetical protein B7X61_13500 [Gallionellales bacterium 39-52-133]HQS58690.1 hypothetical protein [Gallionellaceae bacterium]HQS75030.1 hypothetical protein [Gallionellaceae bacterium]
MCFSATVSYSAAVILAGTGIYAFRQAGRLHPSYRAWALVPLFFGLQQAFEGLVWQALAAENHSAAVRFGLGFHFFSHFLWLWWLPLSSYLVEPGKIKKRVFAGCGIFGAAAGGLVYTVMLLHPEWMTVVVREHSIIYDFSAPYRSDLHLPITPVMLYGLTILIPLLFSSHGLIKIFGGLVILSMALASWFFNAAFVSVWCFFAAVLALYIVFMIHHLAPASVRQD